MDVTKLLEKDHDEVDELFRRFQLASIPETLDELAQSIVRELSIHAAVEELFVYPYIRVRLEGGSEMADHAVAEHAEVKELLTTVEKSDAGSAEHAEAMRQVIESVRHHVEEEESSLFPALREQAGDGTLERLGGVVEGAKALVPTHPHPLVPGTATAQLVAGPWASMLDKVRDLVER